MAICIDPLCDCSRAAPPTRSVPSSATASTIRSNLGILRDSRSPPIICSPYGECDPKRNSHRIITAPVNCKPKPPSTNGSGLRLGLRTLFRHAGAAARPRPLETREPWVERSHSELGFQAGLSPCLPASPPSAFRRRRTQACRQPRTGRGLFHSAAGPHPLFRFHPWPLENLSPLPNDYPGGGPATASLSIQTSSQHPRSRCARTTQRLLIVTPPRLGSDRIDPPFAYSVRCPPSSTLAPRFLAHLHQKNCPESARPSIVTIPQCWSTPDHANHACH